MLTSPGEFGPGSGGSNDDDLEVVWGTGRANDRAMESILVFEARGDECKSRDCQMSPEEQREERSQRAWCRRGEAWGMADVEVEGYRAGGCVQAQDSIVGAATRR